GRPQGTLSGGQVIAPTTKSSITQKKGPSLGRGDPCGRPLLRTHYDERRPAEHRNSANCNSQELPKNRGDHPISLVRWQHPCQRDTSPLLPLRRREVSTYAPTWLSGEWPVLDASCQSSRAGLRRTYVGR